MGKEDRQCSQLACACNNLLMFFCNLRINAWTGRFKHTKKKSQQRQDSRERKQGSQQGQNPIEGRRHGFAFCLHIEHSLSVVVSNVCKLLSPGPVHRIFESLKRNSNDG